MLNEEEQKHITLLNERIQQEQDSAKFAKLIEQLNSFLEATENRTKGLREGMGHIT